VLSAELSAGPHSRRVEFVEREDRMNLEEDLRPHNLLLCAVSTTASRALGAEKQARGSRARRNLLPSPHRSARVFSDGLCKLRGNTLDSDQQVTERLRRPSVVLYLLVHCEHHRLGSKEKCMEKELVHRLDVDPVRIAGL
jgi:hypothetical protein